MALALILEWLFVIGVNARLVDCTTDDDDDDDDETGGEEEEEDDGDDDDDDDVDSNVVEISNDGRCCCRCVDAVEVEQVRATSVVDDDDAERDGRRRARLEE